MEVETIRYPVESTGIKDRRGRERDSRLRNEKDKETVGGQQKPDDMQIHRQISSSCVFVCVTRCTYVAAGLSGLTVTSCGAQNDLKIVENRLSTSKKHRRHLDGGNFRQTIVLSTSLWRKRLWCKNTDRRGAAAAVLKVVNRTARREARVLCVGGLCSKKKIKECVTSIIMVMGRKNTVLWYPVGIIPPRVRRRIHGLDPRTSFKIYSPLRNSPTPESYNNDYSYPPSHRE